MISITDLLTPMTRDQIRTTMVAALETAGVPASKWRKGGTLSTLLTYTAAQLAGFSTLMTQAVSSGYLEKATGGWLKLLAFYVYGVTVPSATFATGFVTLVNGSGFIYTFAPGEAIFLDPVTNKTYSNTTAISLGALATQSGIGVQCTTSGAAGSAPPNEVTGFVTAMNGVTVTNPSSIVGLDAPDDDAIRQLCLDKLGTLSVRGVRNAYSYAVDVAVNPVSGAPVNINRKSISRSSHTGTVTIVVAAPSGVPDPNDVQGVRNSIEVGVPGLSPPFSGARPDCVTVVVSGATPVPYFAPVIVWCSAPDGTTAADLQPIFEAAVLDYIENYPIGGVTTDAGQGLWGSGVDACVRQGAPAGVVVYAVEGPNDLALAAGQVALDDTTTIVRLVTPGSS